MSGTEIGDAGTRLGVAKGLIMGRERCYLPTRGPASSAEPSTDRGSRREGGRGGEGDSERGEGEGDGVLYGGGGMSVGFGAGKSVPGARSTDCQVGCPTGLRCSYALPGTDLRAARYWVLP
eukprot:2562424-Rhodomonas_salina.5